MSKSRKFNGKSSKRTYAANENPSDLNELLNFGKAFPRSPGMAVSVAALGPSAVRLAMSYSTTTNMTSTVGALATYVFTGNGLFDPDVTGSGLQPLGFDQWATLYQRYRSIASNIEVNLSTPGATTNATGSFDVAVAPSNTSSVFSSFTAAASSPYAKMVSFNGNGAPGRKLKSKMDTAVFMGVPPLAVLADDTLQASVSANPTDMWYWHVCAVTSDLTSTATILMFTKVTYLVDFFVKQVLTLSVSEFATTLEEARAMYLETKKLRRVSQKVKDRLKQTSD